VEVIDLRNDSGQVGILLFDKEDGFPGDGLKASRHLMVPIAGRVARAVFNDLPPGRYAIVVMHDENKNDQLDTNMFGIPKEGFGFSNDAKGFMGPPKFRDAAFGLGRAPLTLTVSMRYYGKGGR
jgi:uncharacterized protein (DUF2141 family)